MITLHFLKTVWSDIILLQEDGETALIDAGTAEQFPMLRDYLDRLGVRRLSFMLLTHFHCDHYGGMPALLRHLPVGRVYLKEYSGLDRWTSSGADADDAYRADEMRKYLALRELALEKSELMQVENLNAIEFHGHPIRLYNTQNSVRAIYEDARYPDTFHRYTQTENQNSLAAVMKAHGVNVFFGGDMFDAPGAHPDADHINRRIAAQIGERMDIYKAPHHGTSNTASPEALAVYRPRIAIITNGEPWISQYDAEANLRAANPDVRIYRTEHHHVIVTIADDGQIDVRED